MQLCDPGLQTEGQWPDQAAVREDQQQEREESLSETLKTLVHHHQSWPEEQQGQRGGVTTTLSPSVCLSSPRWSESSRGPDWGLHQGSQQTLPETEGQVLLPRHHCPNPPRKVALASDRALSNILLFFAVRPEVYRSNSDYYRGKVKSVYEKDPLFKDFLRNLTITESSITENTNLSALKQRFNNLVQTKRGPPDKDDPYTPSRVGFFDS